MIDLNRSFCRESYRSGHVIKQLVCGAVNAFGFELTRRRPAPATTYDVQKMMIVRPGPTIFDVGAHAGAASETYRRLFPEAIIHAFEPTPAATDYLGSHFGSDDRLHVHPLALSDRPGEIEFHLNASGATNSLLNSHPEAPLDWRPLVQTRKTVTVPTITIDSFCAVRGISHIDILKIDVQGAESRVLRGAREMLARRAIDLVHLEVIVVPTYAGQSRPDEIFGLLGEAGLMLVDFYDIWKRGPVLLQFDALFALPEYVKRIADRA